MQTKKRILYLSYTGMTDPLGQSQVMAYVEALSKTGAYQFTIISFEKPASFHQKQHEMRQQCDAAGIKWYPLSYTSKPPVLSTFKDVRRMQKLAFELAAKEPFNIVHCRSYIPALTGLRMKKKLGIPFLFDMRGFWADERVDGRLWNLKNPVYNAIYQYFKKKEKAFLQNADHIISLTQAAKDEILKWQLKPAALPITVIPCCADDNLFDPETIAEADKKAARTELHIPENAPVLTYAGSVGTWYLMEEMMDFAKIFLKHFPEAFFLVLTAEPEDVIRRIAFQRNLPFEKIRLKKVSRSLMPLYLSLSSLSVFFIKPSFSKKASSPVKQGELMCMGIPVVCNANVGDTGSIVSQYDAGILVKGFDDASYEAAITRYKQHRFDAQKIRAGACAVFSLRQGVALYHKVYQTIIDGST